MKLNGAKVSKRKWKNCILNYQVSKNLYFKFISSTLNTLNNKISFNNILNIETNLLVYHVKIITDTVYYFLRFRFRHTN